MLCPKCRVIEMRRNRQSNDDLYLCPKCGHRIDKNNKTEE